MRSSFYPVGRLIWQTGRVWFIAIAVCFALAGEAYRRYQAGINISRVCSYDTLWNGTWLFFFLLQRDRCTLNLVDRLFSSAAVRLAGESMNKYSKAGHLRFQDDKCIIKAGSHKISPCVLFVAALLLWKACFGSFSRRLTAVFMRHLFTFCA